MPKEQRTREIFIPNSTSDSFIRAYKWYNEKDTLHWIFETHNALKIYFNEKTVLVNPRAAIECVINDLVKLFMKKFELQPSFSSGNVFFCTDGLINFVSWMPNYNNKWNKIVTRVIESFIDTNPNIKVKLPTRAKKNNVYQDIFYIFNMFNKCYDIKVSVKHNSSDNNSDIFKVYIPIIDTTEVVLKKKLFKKPFYNDKMKIETILNKN